MLKRRLAVLCVVLGMTSAAQATSCGGDFNTFLSNFSTDAQAAGVSPSVISSAFAGLREDQGVLAFDRRQRATFNKTFEQYVSTRVGSGRINGGRALLARHAE